MTANPEAPQQLQTLTQPPVRTYGGIRFDLGEHFTSDLLARWVGPQLEYVPGGHRRVMDPEKQPRLTPVIALDSQEIHNLTVRFALDLREGKHDLVPSHWAKEKFPTEWNELASSDCRPKGDTMMWLGGFIRPSLLPMFLETGMAITKAFVQLSDTRAFVCILGVGGEVGVDRRVPQKDVMPNMHLFARINWNAVTVTASPGNIDVLFEAPDQPDTKPSVEVIALGRKLLAVHPYKEERPPWRPHGGGDPRLRRG